ncbi:MAG: hypothetical protein R2715_10525 [Ilumatobacteraceae bacterium]
MSERVTVELGGRELSLSNLDKVLYPSGFTKAQVIDYYARVAPTAPPHLAGRCLTFRRFPNGSTAEGFFEKRCNKHRPQWIPTSVGPGDQQRNIPYCRIEEPAALVWAANLAALELHAPMALAEDLDVPRAIVFDFDPGAPAAMREAPDRTGCSRRARVGGAARLVQDLGVQRSAALRSHQRPGDARGRWCLRAGGRAAAGEAASGPGDDDDGQGAATREDLRRLSQNTRHKTTIAPYSLRARPEPTVSTPVSWDEVDDCAGGGPELRFTAPEVLDRIEAHGDLFAPVLTLVQPLPGSG